MEREGGAKAVLSRLTAQILSTSFSINWRSGQQAEDYDDRETCVTVRVDCVWSYDLPLQWGLFSRTVR